MDAQKVGRRIQEVRKARSLTQAELAQSLQCSAFHLPEGLGEIADVLKAAHRSNVRNGCMAVGKAIGCLLDAAFPKIR